MAVTFMEISKGSDFAVLWKELGMSTAVQDDDITDEIFSPGAGEEHDGCRDLVGINFSTGRDIRPAPCRVMIGKAFPSRGMNVAEGDGIDSNVVGDELDSHAAGQGIDGTFAGAIGGTVAQNT